MNPRREEITTSGPCAGKTVRARSVPVGSGHEQELTGTHRHVARSARPRVRQYKRQKLCKAVLIDVEALIGVALSSATSQ